MIFSSIKEYFYKLYNVCYAIILVPLGAFIYLYLELQEGNIISLIQDANEVRLAQILFSLFVVIALTSVHLVTKRKMKTLSKEVSLGNKMDGYYVLSLTRLGIGSGVSLFMALGLFLTNSELFGLLFLAILVWMSLQWPSPRKLCADLGLKGDERELVLYKRDSLS